MGLPQGKDSPTSYDKLIKSLLHRYPADFPTLLFGRRPVAVTPVPTGLTVVAERFADHLQHVQFDQGAPALLHLEFQGKGQRQMPNRMNEYLAIILGVLERPALKGSKLACAVIYLDPEGHVEDPGFLRYEGLLGLKVQVEYLVLNLWDQDPDKVAGLGLPGLYPFLPLLRGRPEELVLRSRSKILAAPEAQVPVEARRELLLVLAGLAGKVIKDKLLLQRLLAEIGIMDKNYFFDLVREEMRAVMEPELRQKVKREVRQELEQEVRQEVEREVRRELEHEVRQEVEQEVRQEVRQELRQEVRRELKQEVRQELKQEVRRELEQEVRQEVAREVRQSAEHGRLVEARRVILQALRARCGEPPAGLAARLEEIADLVVLESLLAEAVVCQDAADFLRRSALLDRP